MCICTHSMVIIYRVEAMHMVGGQLDLLTTNWEPVFLWHRGPRNCLVEVARCGY